MPLTRMHAELLALIAANRNPDSYVAGATVLHIAEDTPRFSDDLDLFHDLEDSVAQSAETDAATLRAAGCEVSCLWQGPGYTPQFLLDYACRHVAYTQEDLDRLSLREPLDLGAMKRRWLAAVEELLLRKPESRTSADREPGTLHPGISSGRAAFHERTIDQWWESRAGGNRERRVRRTLPR